VLAISEDKVMEVGLISCELVNVQPINNTGINIEVYMMEMSFLLK